MIIVNGIKLKRCPFCGNVDAPTFTTAAELQECKAYEVDVETCPEFDYYAHALYNGRECRMKAVICDATAGGCGAHTRYYGDEYDAADAWNTRAAVAVYDECEEYE